MSNDKNSTNAMIPKEINSTFMRLAHRAETTERAKLVETFVDIGPLVTLLSTHNHQITYGRRGTGKTHALVFLTEKAIERKEIPVYVDLRQIGSTGGIYADPNISITERGTRLLADTLAAFHRGLLATVQEREDLNLGDSGDALNELADEITRVIVSGPVQLEGARNATTSLEDAGNFEMKIGTSGLSASLAGSEKVGQSASRGDKITQSGEIRHRVHFGAVGNALTKFVKSVGAKRVWLILDEWSAIPLELQPFLADLLRRCVFPVRGITVKIGAIEQRSRFQLSGTGDYIGIELGADASADLNLDDFMVFDNDEARATEFFEQLLFTHFKSVVNVPALRQAIQTPGALTQAAFTRYDVLKEFVRATEGVPRDAINILSLAAQNAFDVKISMEHIRTAAKTWYQRDKDQAVAANPKAKNLLHKIIDEVIGHRQARAFLFRSDARHELIDELFDKRVLHVLKKNISAHDEPGIRYDALKIDYGCYVDLLTTNKAPQGLFPIDDTEGEEEAKYVNVPPDDYRAIRRAILKLPEVF